MSADLKIQKQMRYAETLLRSGAFPFTGALASVVPDPPDVELIGTSQRIAIEVTELYQDPKHRPFAFTGRPRQAFERECRKLLAEIESRWVASRPGPIRAQIMFAEPLDLGGTRREQIPRWLISQLEAMHSTCPNPGTQIWKPQGYAVGVIGVVIWRSPSLQRSEFFHTDLGFPSTLSVAPLQASVDAKERRLPHYASRYNECHLLIAIPQAGLSSMFNLAKFGAVGIQSTAFHGVWLLDERGKTVQRLFPLNPVVGFGAPDPVAAHLRSRLPGAPGPSPSV